MKQTPAYFVTNKWVFSRSARQRAKKAHAILDSAKWHLYGSRVEQPPTGSGQAVWDAFYRSERDTQVACDLLNSASGRVADAHDEEQRQAEISQEAS